MRSHRIGRRWIAAAGAAVAAAGGVRAGVSGFLDPARHVGPPLACHAPTNRAFQGIPSLAVSPAGRLWATWYAGVTPGEDQNNYAVLSTSGDGGATWREVLVADPDAEGPVRAYDPEIWMAPDGTLRWFWAQTVGHNGSTAGVWMVEIANPDDEIPKWKGPRRVTDGVMMCKPMVLSTGEWVVPASTWRETDFSARMVVSTDGGRHWTVRGGCNVPTETRQFDEHMFVERTDGSIWLLARTKYGIGQSVSTDRGRTWPELTPSAIPHPGARFFITRLSSGSLLLVKHGPMTARTGRSHLTAFISADDGATWRGGLLLDERTGVSYPDGQQTSDGVIWIIYDYSRTGDRHILMSVFREEDAAAGKDVSGAVRLRQLVSQASGGRAASRPFPAHRRDNSDGEALRRAPAGAWSGAGAESAPLVAGARLFSDRGYVASEVPAELNGAMFLRVAMDGAKRLRCHRAGVVFFLTPQPERNKDSVAPTLLQQNFKRVALSEVPLFNPSSAGNYCTLYQRLCSAGEEFEFGKWAVPIFFP